jgi:hypothetical protein
MMEGWSPPPDTIERIKAREYECFIEDHEPLPWTPGRCADYAGRSLHLMRCKRKDGYGLGGLCCRQHAKDNPE